MRLAGFPAGLLDLVGAQNFGSAPNNLSDVIVPTLNIDDLYLAGRVEQIATVGDVIAVGTNGTKIFVHTVPAGELWRVWAGSALASTAAGEAVVFTPILLFGNSPIAAGPTTTLGASANGFAQMTSLPLWLRSGTKIGIWGHSATGVPSGSVALAVTRLRG